MEAKISYTNLNNYQFRSIPKYNNPIQTINEAYKNNGDLFTRSVPARFENNVSFGSIFSNKKKETVHKYRRFAKIYKEYEKCFENTLRNETFCLPKNNRDLLEEAETIFHSLDKSLYGKHSYYLIGTYLRMACIQLQNLRFNEAVYVLEKAKELLPSIKSPERKKELMEEIEYQIKGSQRYKENIGFAPLLDTFDQAYDYYDEKYATSQSQESSKYIEDTQKLKIELSNLVQNMLEKMEEEDKFFIIQPLINLAGIQGTCTEFQEAYNSLDTARDIFNSIKDQYDEKTANNILNAINNTEGNIYYLEQKVKPYIQKK